MMKKVYRSISILAALLTILVLTVSVSAAEVTGLKAFLDTAQYQPGIFSDVPVNAWYFNGVRTVYNKGLMGGVGDGQFSPSTPVTWSQAVTIAARIHAVYYGREIADMDGAWYLRYLDYARSANLLPSTCPSEEELNSTVITRAELAKLFRNVLAESDLPAVNDIVAPDIASVDAEFRSAASELYTSGIFTGKEGGKFDPQGPATRAEIATIVTRLLYPAQRASSDSRANQAMVNQYGNFLMGGFATESDEVVYYTIREGQRINNEASNLYSVIARKDNGECSTVYSTKKPIGHLSMGDDRSLYLIEDDKSLVSIEPSSGKSRTLYTSRYRLEIYTLYKGEIYLMEQAAESADVHKTPYHIGRVNGQLLDVMMDGIRWNARLYTDDSFYCFGEKLYFLYGDQSHMANGYEDYDYSLWSIDLKTKAKEKVIDGSRLETLYMSEVAYQGATMWFLSANDSQSDIWLKRVNLLMPDLPETVAHIPTEAQKSYLNMYANGNDLYYQSSGAQRVWSVSSSGVFSEVMKLDTPYIEYSTATRQGILDHALQWVKSIYSEQIDVLLPNGTTVSYPSFLERPYVVKGRYASENLLDEKLWDAEQTESGDIGSSMVREYRTSQGDYVAEIEFNNQMEQKIEIACITFDIDIGGTMLNRDIFIYETLSPGGKVIYSLILPPWLVDGITNEGIDLSWSFLWHLAE